MAITDVLALIVWGYLSGFVVWASVFRLVEPIAQWLLPTPRGKEVAIVLSRVLVGAFLLILAFVIVDSMRQLLTVGGRIVGPELRRNAFGLEFLASFVGLMTFGVLRRFVGLWRSDDTV